MINQDLNSLDSHNFCTWQVCLIRGRLWVLDRCRWFCSWFTLSWCTGDSRVFSSQVFSTWQLRRHLRTFLWQAIRKVPYWFTFCYKTRCRWILTAGGEFAWFSICFKPLSVHQEEHSRRLSFVSETIRAQARSAQSLLGPFWFWGFLFWALGVVSFQIIYNLWILL